MTTNKTIDLNCDLGEGFPHDEKIFTLISSTNIACGGHAGDRSSILKCLAFCEKYDVAAGAHPSYPDKENFGRLSIKIPANELKDAIRSQLDLFSEAALKQQIPVHHVKLHGALYNDCAVNKELAEQMLEVMKEYAIKQVYGLSGSLYNRIARQMGFEAIDEVFADRAYLRDGQLAPRTMQGAVLDTREKVNEQLASILNRKEAKAITGEIISLEGGTVCLHGDTHVAGEFIREIRKLINELNFSVSYPA